MPSTPLLCSTVRDEKLVASGHQLLSSHAAEPADGLSLAGHWRICFEVEVQFGLSKARVIWQRKVNRTRSQVNRDHRDRDRVGGPAGKMASMTCIHAGPLWPLTGITYTTFTQTKRDSLDGGYVKAIILHRHLDGKMEMMKEL